MTLKTKAYTTEEALRKTLDENPGIIAIIRNTQDGGTIHLTLSFSIKMDMPASYAKAVLADYLKEMATELTGETP
jgi:hypothetical protein